MIWFEFTARDGMKHLVNVNHIIDIKYNADVDLTSITMDRAHSDVIFVHGNKVTEMSKLIARNDKCILHKLGE